MDEKNLELEYKFAADHVDKSVFRKVMMDANPDGFDHVSFDYDFWEKGGSIIRHRVKDDGELTVKERLSDDSTTERIEVNLGLQSGQDVYGFLHVLGYRRLFTLHKSHVDVFDFERRDHKIEAALYTVARLDEMAAPFGARTFIEVEIRPGDITKDKAMCVLQDWGQWLSGHLCLGRPLNLSLFEHYSKLAPPNYLPTLPNYRI